jgi:hypothetical protein
MTGDESNDSSPVEFAFEPPSMSDPTYSFKTDTKALYVNTYTPTSTSSATFSYQGYNNCGVAGSSFSSATSGSAGPGSFSSADALPAISRNFTRPSPTETRRPATAAGALQRSGFNGFQRIDNGEERAEAIEETPDVMFSNPFGSPKDDRQVPSQEGIDPRLHPQGRRASEGQFVCQSPSWPANQYMPQSSAPADVTHFNVLQQMQTHHQMMQRPAAGMLNNRPQTSDGLPTYSGVGSNISLPSARTLVNQIDPSGSYYTPAAQIRYEDKTMVTSSLMPFRDTPSMSDVQMPGRYSLDAGRPSTAVRPSYIPPGKAETKPNGELTFVPLGGPAPKKRPRRRFDEIERLYLCGWNGCEKAYGTLNHLNAHVAMQKHGDKRLPTGESHSQRSESHH